MKTHASQVTPRFWLNVNNDVPQLVVNGKPTTSHADYEKYFAVALR